MKEKRRQGKSSPVKGNDGMKNNKATPAKSLGQASQAEIKPYEVKKKKSPKDLANLDEKIIGNPVAVAESSHLTNSFNYRSNSNLQKLDLAQVKPSLEEQHKGARTLKQDKSKKIHQQNI